MSISKNYSIYINMLLFNINSDMLISIYILMTEICYNSIIHYSKKYLDIFWLFIIKKMSKVTNLCKNGKKSKLFFWYINMKTPMYDYA